MNKRALALLVSATMLLPAAASAVCVQADLAGKWQLYLQSDLFEEHCTLQISKTGNVANTTCDAIDSGIPETSPLTNATVALLNNCTFTAAFQTGDIQSRIRHATLSRDKQTASGIGLMSDRQPPASRFSAGFTFSLVKN